MTPRSRGAHRALAMAALEGIPDPEDRAVIAADLPAR
jgi:hypothetical protein